MDNQGRLQQLREVAELASNKGRFDIVEQVYLDMKELDSIIEEKTNLLTMDNHYVQTTPMDQILSNQINNLIQYFGRDKVEAMFNIFYPNKTSDIAETWMDLTKRK